jgi:hypothetical protein
MIVASAVLVIMGSRFYQKHRFLSTRTEFSAIEIAFKFEDALSDPRACSVTHLGTLRMSGDGSFEFKANQQKLGGAYEPSKVALNLSQFYKLEQLVGKEPQPNHSTGFTVEVRSADKEWTASFDDFEELSSNELLEAYTTGRVAGLSRIKGDDIVGTFVTEALGALPLEERKAISEAMTRSLATVDMVRLSKVWPAAHWEARFLERIRR